MKRAPKIFFTLLLLMLFGFSCSSEKESDIELSNEVNIIDKENINQIVNSFENYYNDDSHSSDYIYDQNKLHRFDIYLTQKNLSEIDSNPVAEEYVEGFLVFEGKVVKNIGIRYKGSIGAWVVCLSGEDWTNPSGYKTCPKTRPSWCPTSGMNYINVIY